MLAEADQQFDYNPECMDPSSQDMEDEILDTGFVPIGDNEHSDDREGVHQRNSCAAFIYCTFS